MLCFTERVVSASKGSPHNNDILLHFFFLHQIDIQEFWGRYICIKTVNVKTNRYSFFFHRVFSCQAKVVMSFQQQSKLVLCPSKMDFCPTSIYLVLRYLYYITELLCTVNNLYFRIKHK